MAEAGFKSNTNLTPECLTSVTYHLPETPLANTSLPCWKPYKDSHLPKVKTWPFIYCTWLCLIHKFLEYLYYQLSILFWSIPYFAFPHIHQTCYFLFNVFLSPRNACSKHHRVRNHVWFYPLFNSQCLGQWQEHCRHLITICGMNESSSVFFTSWGRWFYDIYLWYLPPPFSNYHLAQY